MKAKYFGTLMILLIILFALPVGFATSLDENVTADDSSSNMTGMPIDEDYSLKDTSYFDGNNSIEEPILDDEFANPRISFTDRNTFYVNASYNGSNELGTKANPFKDIGSAFSGLTVNRSVVNIYIAEGSYEVSKSIDITKNLNIIGQNPLNTIIHGKNSTQIFFVNKNNLAINIINLTFTQANTYYGGAIYNNRSTVKLINDVFRDNYAIGYTSKLENYSAAGAALYNEAGTYKIYNSSFINNCAKSSLNVYGAAIYNDLGTLSILSSKFINNSLDDASYGSGGAIYNFNGFLTVCNSTFSDNTINSNYSIGGAIYNYEAHNVYIINSTFDSNRIYGNYTLGSAIANSAIILEVVNSTVSNNAAFGTAPLNSTIYSFNGFYNFINSTFTNNTISNPKVTLMCLEEQFIYSQIFNDTDDLPSKYDLRDEGLVTYAKDQGSSGACWAFSTIAALESYLLKYENVSYDISENNLKNLMNYKGINGTDWPEGGNYQMALAYFLRWDGPVDESDDYFSYYSTIPNYDVEAIKHVQDAMFVPIRLGYLDNDQIKSAIMKYGAVYASVYGTSMIKNVYNSVAEIPNHAVAIVGWDDNYPANRFLGTKPPANGAFIIKNSWGTSYGDKGFGYVSYYDKTFAGFSLDSLSVMAFTNVEDITNYKDIYQYDILGNTFESLGYGDSTVWFANQFNAISDNPLSAFGLYTYGKSTYLADIYVNGNLKYSQEGNIGYAGYHTIKLNELVNLTMGDTFRINIRLTTPESLFPVAIESLRNGYSSKATSGPNQSFISPDGINWFDIGNDFELAKISGCLYNKTIEQANVCLKAYTENVGNLQLDVTSSSSYFLKGDEVQFTFNLTNIGDYTRGINLTFSFDNVINITGINLTDGVFINNAWFINELNHKKSAILNLTFKMLEIKEFVQNSVTIASSDLIKNNNEEINFNLSYQGITSFALKNVTLLSKSGEMVNITILDASSKPVSNVSVIVTFDNGDEISLTSDNGGVIKVPINLVEGSYRADFSFIGDDVYMPNSQSFSINIVKRHAVLANASGSTFYHGDGPVILLMGENASLANKSIAIKAIGKSNSYTFNQTTDDNGTVNVNGLKADDYKITCSFDGDEMYYGTDCTFDVSIIKKQTVLSSKSISTYAVVVKVDGKTGPYLKVTLKDLLHS